MTLLVGSCGQTGSEAMRFEAKKRDETTGRGGIGNANGGEGDPWFVRARGMRMGNVAGRVEERAEEKGKDR